MPTSTSPPDILQSAELPESIAPPMSPWCNYEPGDFDASEFEHDPEHGTVHLVSPLHNTAGQVFGGSLPGALRHNLERVLGRERLKELLTDE
jgi:hypothetical protein